jgi:hypothetical protein
MKKIPVSHFVFKPVSRLLLFLWILLLAYACQQGPDRSRGTADTWETTTQDTIATSDYVRENQQDVIIEYETHFSQVEERIEMIRHRADTIHGDARLQHNQTLGNLEQQRLDAEERLNELRKSSEDTWNILEQEVERTLTQLELAVEQAENELD